MEAQSAEDVMNKKYKRHSGTNVCSNFQQHLSCLPKCNMWGMPWTYTGRHGFYPTISLSLTWSRLCCNVCGGPAALGPWSSGCSTVLQHQALCLANLLFFKA